MEQARHNQRSRPSAEIVDFDEALLSACAPELRDELLTEAELLASALPAETRSAELLTMAQALSVGRPGEAMDRGRARRLAAALRHVAGRPTA